MLQLSTQVLISDDQCRKLYPGELLDEHFCTFGEQLCYVSNSTRMIVERLFITNVCWYFAFQGYAGSPLVWHSQDGPVIAGIVSYAVP